MALKKTMKGIVVSDKGDKTAVVVVSRRSQTNYKGKTVKKLVRYLVHDPKNEAKVGDSVEITQSRPISRNKRWRLFKTDPVSAIISDSIEIDNEGNLE